MTNAIITAIKTKKAHIPPTTAIITVKTEIIKFYDVIHLCTILVILRENSLEILSSIPHQRID